MFSGLQAACEDLRRSADRFFDTQKLFDLRIYSSLGLTEDDVKSLEGIEKIAQAEAGFQEDADILVGENTASVTFHALPKFFNQPFLLKGRLPEKPGEAAVTQKFLHDTGAAVGDIVIIPEEEELAAEEDELDFDKPATTLGIREFRIVGSVIDALEVTNTASGSVSYRNASTNKDNIYVLSEAFDTDVYSVIYLRLDDAEDMPSYSDDYENYVSDVRIAIEEAIMEDREKARYRDVTQEIEERIDEAETEARRELADARQELKEGEKTLQDELLEAEAELKDGKAKLAEGEQQLAEGEAQLNQKEQEAEYRLASGWNTLQEKRKELEAGEKELQEKAASAESQFAEGAEKIAEGRKELASRREATQIELEAGREKIETAQAQLDAGLAQVQEGQEKLQAGKEQLETALEGLRSGRAELETGMEQIDAGIAEAESGQQQLQTAIQQSEEQLAGLRKQAEEGGETEEISAQILALEAQIADLKGKAEAAAAALAELNGQKSGLSEQLAALTAEEESLAAKLSEAEFQQKELETQASELQKQQELLAAQREEMDSQEKSATEQFAAAEQELNEQEQLLEAGKAELEDAKSQLAEGRKQLEEGERTYQIQAAQARDQLADARNEIENNKEKLRESAKELSEGRVEYERGKQEGEAELSEGWQDFYDGAWDAAEKLSDARRKLQDIDMTDWYIQDRNSLGSYANIGSDADSIDAIATVFPIVFFIVAILISLTTIARMVDEDRGLIGTYKALGYTDIEIRRKYLIYTGAAGGIGSLIGTGFAFVLLPKFIFWIFKRMYLLPSYQYGILPVRGLLGAVLFIGGVMLAALLACRKELQNTPADLMRPRAPKPGMRVFLERIPSLWNKMAFLNKITARNLFRYKGRLLMTIAGIAGCTALLLFGFAIRDSVKDLMPRQYEQTVHYNLMAVSAAEDFDVLEKAMHSSEIAAYTEAAITTLTLRNNERKELETQLIVVPDSGSLAEYITLETPEGQERDLQDSEVYITQNAGNVLGFSDGDTIQAQLPDLTKAVLPVTTLVKNYLGNYVYMTQSTYETFFGGYEKNAVLALFREDAADIQFVEELGDRPEVLVCMRTQKLRDEYSSAFELINMVVYVVIVMSAALAFVVLFTLATTNISERERELATIKVLGFYDGEVHRYIDKETLILTGIGIALGIPLGWAFAQTLTSILNLPAIYLAVSLHPASYFMAAALSFGFSLIVNAITDRTLNRIDPVEALKSVE